MTALTLVATTLSSAVPGQTARAAATEHVTGQVVSSDGGRRSLDGAVGASVSTAEKFTATPRPRIAGLANGRARIGTTLTARHQPGQWSPRPTTVSYQWRADGKAIAGATRATFTPRARHHGQRISVRVAVSRPGYETVRVTSRTAMASRSYTRAPRPKITGTARVGQTLTARPGEWRASPRTFAYQWKRDGKPITKATSRSYQLKKADHGKHITVTVTAKRKAYVLTHRTSAATATVRWPVGIKHKPRITSRPKGATVAPGRTVTFAASATGGKLRYQWQRRTATGTWKNMPGKTSRSVTVKATSKRTLWDYRVRVKNRAGTTFSRPALLVVNSTKTDPFRPGQWYAGNTLTQRVSKSWNVRRGMPDDPDWKWSYTAATLTACSPPGEPRPTLRRLDIRYTWRGPEPVWSEQMQWAELQWRDDQCAAWTIYAGAGPRRAPGGMWQIRDKYKTDRYGKSTQFVRGIP
ncbi:hypothetical protein [Isoptericola croceus]|uniref:hypothetical protein n=1 Tax=Isoptericola croceus TaxID=3031406 RepID=UPI0023F6BE9C|nr:hypothetical protein [Isoptericola croceus]